MSATVSRLQVEHLDAVYRLLLADLVIRGSRGDEWVIPAGSVTDFATVPRPATPFVPRDDAYAAAAVAHDRLCEIADGTIPSTRYPEGLPTEKALELAAYAEHRGLVAAGDLPTYVSRRDADGVYRSLLEDLGASFPRRWSQWAAVRLGGLMSEATLGDWWRVLLIGALTLPAVAVPFVLNAVVLGATWLIERTFGLVGLE